MLVGFESESGPIGATPLPVSSSETPYFRQVLHQAKTLTITDVQALPLAAPLRDHIAQQQIQRCHARTTDGAWGGHRAFGDSDGSGRSQFFPSDQVRLAETVAGDIAAAVENARLLEQEQRAAVSEERNRIARDLHDSVTQTVYSASLIAKSLPFVWNKHPERIRTEVSTTLLRA